MGNTLYTTAVLTRNGVLQMRLWWVVLLIGLLYMWFLLTANRSGIIQFRKKFIQRTFVEEWSEKKKGPE